ncbi:LCP family protein [Streptomyces sp. NPDC051561]|uniref:LCP family protein n=1 Tax=Streptomyces sp. NPDC051561 TaxID=3365658 RepID=UPI0037B429CC
MSGGRAANRRKQRRPRSKKSIFLLFVLLPVLLLAGTGATWLYFKFDGNLRAVDIDGEIGGDRPPEVDNGSRDILVLGSDSRGGENKKYGEDVGSARSDVAMIVHVHKGGDKASIVSIPRDTLVTRPQCVGRTKIRPEAKRQMFNTAYEIGGPVCAVKTAEKLSGIRMDNYLEVDFSGFKGLIDSLGGVSMTTNKAIKDPKSHLDLPPGTHQLTGEQSLGLVRTRKTVGDGSDLGRIQLQQAFMKALMEQIKDIGITSPKKMFNLADAATKTITTDSKLNSVGSLLSFGNSLSGIGSKDMKVITLPIDYDAIDKERVIPLKDQSELLWLALRMDKPIPPSVTENSAGDQVDAGKIISGG